MEERQNKAVVKRFIEEMWNQRHLELAHKLLAANCVTHQLRGGTDLPAPRPPQSVITEAEAWLAAFPDLKFDVEQMIAADDQVVSQITMRGTQTGPWMGMPPSGKTVSVPMITIHRIRGGKIVEDWVLVGSLALFQQLDLLPQTEKILSIGNTSRG